MENGRYGYEKVKVIDFNCFHSEEFRHDFSQTLAARRLSYNIRTLYDINFYRSRQWLLFIW
ncbi:MAG: hypothetical protein CMF25_01355 [Kangiellaceae bacterium]|nr:hypothetical protein [Kangiellaceae bacterium]